MRLMKRLKHSRVSNIPVFLLILALVAGALAGCGGPKNTGSPDSTQTGGEPAASDNASAKPDDASADSGEQLAGSEAPVKPEIKNAQNFDIEYLENNVKLVTDSDGRKLLLVPKEGEVPTGYEDAVLVRTPVSHAMYTSTTHIGYLDSLEEESLYDTIAAVTTQEADWTLPQVKERFANGQITYVAQDHWNAGDIEEIIQVDPEIVFSGGGDESGVKLRALLDESKIDYAVVTDWTEKDNAAILEWIKFFGAFFNLDEKADRIYEKKLARMEELYNKTADIPEKDRPVVAYCLIYDGIVYTQAGNSAFAREMEKAGGVYALKDLEGEGSVQIGMEEFFDKCKDADVLIYGSLPQYLADKAALLETEPLFSECKAFQNDRVYIFDQGYYMNSARVAEKFEDVVAMFHPDLLPGHQFTMYQKLPDAPKK